MVLESYKLKLTTLSEEKYRTFSLLHNPTAKNVLGVRLPFLRRMARDIGKDDEEMFLMVNDFSSHELLLLQAIVLGHAKISSAKRLHYLHLFLPYVEDWAVCDTLVSSLKSCKLEQGVMWEYITAFKTSKKPFFVRFMVVMMLSYYLNDQYVDKVMTLLDTIKLDHYYVKMALAWALATLMAKYPRQTEAYLEKCTLDNWTYNKAIQKMKESYRVTAENKAKLQLMKRTRGEKNEIFRKT